MLLPSGAYAVAQTATIRSISYLTLTECTVNSREAGGSTCVSDGNGGYYFEPIDTPVFEIEDDIIELDPITDQPQIKCWSALSGCSSACTNGLCVKDSLLSCYTCEPAQEFQRLCQYISQSACNSACSGTCTGSGSCYNCLLVKEWEPIDYTVDPVSSCPSGTTKDPNCECCINN